MPTPRFHRFLILLLAPAIGLACESPDIDDATRTEVVAMGNEAAMSLVSTLGQRLTTHLEDAGPERAITFCSDQAQPLTDSVSNTLDAGWAVKRTSTQTRNPRNAPDSMEAEALTYFTEATAAGSLPEDFVQTTPEGDYRYYMPLQIGEMCLQCHGPRDALAPRVREVLDTRYPADQATGYAEGDLRGLVRVTVPREAVR